MFCKLHFKSLYASAKNQKQNGPSDKICEENMREVSKSCYNCEEQGSPCLDSYIIIDCVLAKLIVI